VRADHAGYLFGRTAGITHDDGILNRYIRGSWFKCELMQEITHRFLHLTTLIGKGI
jgi:hypothetical protein